MATPPLTDAPHLRGLPLIGNLLDVRRSRLDFLLRVSRECGPLGGFRLGSHTLLLVNSSELVREVLVERADDFEKPTLERAFLQPAFGNGLVLSENAINRRHRKLVAPAFHKRQFVTYADIVVNYTKRILLQWKEGEVVDLAREMARLMLWINGKLLFSTELLDESSELGQALITGQRYANAKFSALIPTPYSWPTPGNLRFHQAMARLDTTLLPMIAERKHAPQEQSDLLSLLLETRDVEDGSFLREIEVRDEAMNFLLAGHETMANALCWTCYLLTQHPEVYQQLRDEGNRVLGGRPPNYSDLPQLSYTLQVFKEALRLYPPVYMIGRQAVHSLELGGYHLPVGAVIVISPYAMHRRPDYFPEPERFNPDRFTQEAEQGLPSHAYLPFSAGPRICIGNRLALMEGPLILSLLSQHAVFQLVDGQHIIPDPLITLRPRNGMNMIVRYR